MVHYASPLELNFSITENWEHKIYSEIRGFHPLLACNPYIFVVYHFVASFP
jgi:hypothetical protein